MKLWFPPLLLALTACQSAGSSGTVQAVDAVEAPKRVSLDKLRKRVSAAEKAHGEASREHRMKVSERELAELEAAADAASAAEAVRSARVELEAAQAARRRFDSLERKVEIGDTELAVARAREGLRTAETDLLGILEIFEEESEARAKDEIIRRNEVAVATAKARVEQAELRQAMVVEAELPARMARLSEAVRAAEAKLAAAEARAARVALRGELDVAKAKVDEREARDAARKTEKERAEARKRFKAETKRRAEAKAAAEAAAEGAATEATSEATSESTAASTAASTSGPTDGSGAEG